MKDSGSIDRQTALLQNEPQMPDMVQMVMGLKYGTEKNQCHPHSSNVFQTPQTYACIYDYTVFLISK